MPKAIKSVLGLSHNFIVNPSFTFDGDFDKMLNRLERDIHLKVFFADEPWDYNPPPLYVKSTWRPKYSSIPAEVDRRLAAYFRSIRRLFVRTKARSNLLPFQHRLLAWLKSQTEYLIARTDKGLGPCAVEFVRYVHDGLVHLNDTSTYQPMTEEDAWAHARETYLLIFNWTLEWSRRPKNWLDKSSKDYIQLHLQRNMKDPFGYFYLMYKVHKSPLKTRPVLSDCASILNPLGKWVDTMLQPIAKTMPAYFKDSFALKDVLDNFVVPPRARIFSCDAQSMYPNIDTNTALADIAAFLRDDETQRRFPHYHPEMLITALEIVMTRSVLRFGDIYRKQISGTAMGSPPAPPWATIFFGLKEKKFLPVWRIWLPLYLRFIDDVFAMWVPVSDDPADDDAHWASFKATVNDGCLTWDFTERGLTLDFMDLRISIVGDRFETTLYEKPMALHLYIPPHSGHPPGVTSGHVSGEILRIFRLCTHEEDRTEKVCIFFRRLTHRGHTPSDLLPKFRKGLANARKFMATSEARRQALKRQKEEAARRVVYFHRVYHPQGPRSSDIVQLFDTHVLSPPGEDHFRELRPDNWDIPVESMIVCNHRAPNLGNMLSYRKIHNRHGPPVSHYSGD